jgi:hypothetical protein
MIARKLIIVLVHLYPIRNVIAKIYRCQHFSFGNESLKRNLNDKTKKPKTFKFINIVVLIIFYVFTATKRKSNGVKQNHGQRYKKKKIKK